MVNYNYYFYALPIQVVLVGDEQGEVTVYLLRNIPKPSDHQVMSDVWSYFDIAMYGSNNGCSC